MTSITLRRSATDLAVKLKFASGLPGVPGEASDLQEGSVATLDASADASFSITGTPPNQILNLSLPRGMTGPVGEGSGGLFFESRTAAASATIGTGISAIRTAGFAAFGDGGHGLYKRRSTHPYKLWQAGQNYSFLDYWPQYYRNSAGTYYKMMNDLEVGVTSVEPTHTTVGQQVTGADGITWKALALNPFYFRSVDRLKADFTTSAADGGWWELVPDGGDIWIEQFGGIADGVDGTPPTGTDNHPGLMHALDIPARAVHAIQYYTHRIKCRGGNYYFSQTIEMHSIAHILGAGGTSVDGHGAGVATHWLFPADTTGVVIHGSTTGGGQDSNTPNLGQAAGTCLESISLKLRGTSANAHGILMRAMATLRNIQVLSPPGIGIWIRGTVGVGDSRLGNANSWKMFDIKVQDAGGDFVRASGTDTNGGICVGLVTHGGGGGVGGCGVSDQSSIGSNSWIGLQITGYGNGGVYYDGKHYQLLRGAGPSPTAEPNTTTPGTNPEVWYPLRSGQTEFPGVSGFPTWSPTGDYSKLKMPIHCSGNYSVFYTPYVEAGNVVSYVQSPARIDGGNAGHTNSSMAVQGQFNSHRYTGRVISLIQPQDTGSAEYAAMNGLSYVGVGGGYNQSDYVTGQQIFIHNRYLDGDVEAQYGYVGPNYLRYSLRTDQPFIWEITTQSNTVQNYGRATPIGYRIGFNDVALYDRTQTGFARIFGARAVIPASGEIARGETYVNTSVTAGGKLFWTCTTQGVIGSTAVIKPAGAVDA